MTLYRDQLVEAVVSALLAANTLAGERVYSNRNWPTVIQGLPVIRVKGIYERKQSLLRGSPQFTTTSTIAVFIQTTGDTEAAAELAGATICEQIEQAVIAGNSPVDQMVQQFSAVETEIRSSSEGEQPIAEILLKIDCEFYENIVVINGDELCGVEMDVSVPGNSTPITAGAGTISSNM